ncbi:MAG: hypothetical protein V4515_12320 [Chloroflexota bacterium]
MKTLLVLAMLVGACSSGGRAATDRPADPTERPTPEPPAYTLPPNFGVVAFGLDYDPDTLEIIKPTERFKATYPAIAYSASLTEGAGAAKLRLVVASVSASGSERVLIDEDVAVSNPAADTFANKVDLASILDNKPGTYVMRFLRDATVLAEGTFTLVK